MKRPFAARQSILLARRPKRPEAKRRADLYASQTSCLAVAGGFMVQKIGGVCLAAIIAGQRLFRRDTPRRYFRAVGDVSRSPTPSANVRSFASQDSPQHRRCRRQLSPTPARMQRSGSGHGRRRAQGDHAGLAHGDHAGLAHGDHAGLAMEAMQRCTGPAVTVAGRSVSMGLICRVFQAGTSRAGVSGRPWRKYQES
jgi:hypothetical protein